MIKQQLEELKLKAHEWAQLDEFIKKAVHGNLTFKVISNKPISASLTIQELLNTTSQAVLETFVEGLERLIKDSGSSRLKKNKQYYTGTVTADELADILALILRNKEYRSAQNIVKEELRKIEEELANLETPQEKRERLLKQKQELTS